MANVANEAQVIQETNAAQKGLTANYKPQVTAVPKVSNPNGSPSFWQRLQVDGVNMAKAVADKTKGLAKDTVDAGKDVIGAAKNVADTEKGEVGVLTHNKVAVDNAVEGMHRNAPALHAVESTANSFIKPVVKAGADVTDLVDMALSKIPGYKGDTNVESALRGTKVGNAISNYLGKPDNIKQMAGNAVQTGILVANIPTGGGASALDMGGEFLIKQIGESGVKQIAEKLGIDTSKVIEEGDLSQLAGRVAKTSAGKSAVRSLATNAPSFLSRFAKSVGKGAAEFGTFNAAGAASDNASGKDILKAGEKGAEVGAVLGGGASLLKKAGQVRTDARTPVSPDEVKGLAKTKANNDLADERGLPEGQKSNQLKAGTSTAPKQLGTGTSSQVKALQDRVTKFQTGELKITPEEAKADATKLKALKSGEPEKPNIENNSKPLKPKSPGLGEAGHANPAQAGKDVKDMISKHNETTQFSKDIAKNSDIVEGKKNIIRNDAGKIITNRTQLSRAEKKTLQNYRDAKAAGLTDAASKFKLSSKLVKEDADVTELNKESQKADAARARLEGNEAKAQAIEARDPSIYTHRVAQNKGSTYDYVAQGDRSSAFGRGLTKSKSGDKSRTMYNLTDENGTRHTVSIKNNAIQDSEGRTVKRINKQVTEYTRQGQNSRSLGSLNLKSNEENMQKELTPVQRNIDNLTKEKQILSSTKSRSEAASTRLANIEDKLKEAHSDYATILNKYDLNELDGKTFKGKDGHTYTFGQATVDEVQNNAGQKYYVDPKLNATANYVESKTAYENAKFIEQIKTSPNVEDFISKPGETAPPGFKSIPSLPQFQGYKFEPKTADVLKDIVGSKDSEANILNRVGRFLRQSIVYFPVKHNLNMAAGYMVDRGITKLASPLAYKRMVSSLYQATLDVMHQTDFYQEVQKKGFQLVSGEGGELDRAFRTEIKGLLDNKDVLGQVAHQVGSTPERLGAAYSKVQHVMVWQAQDILNIARIRERMSATMLSKGEDFDTAVNNTGKYNLQYKVPARVAGSRQLSKGLKSDIVFFGTYRYDLYRTFTNILKGAVNLKDPKGAMEAWDKLAATAVGLSLVVPYVDKEIQKITGNPNAHMSAPGILAVPADAAKLLGGKETVGGFVNSQVYLSSAYTLPYQIATNNNGLNETVYNPYAPGKTQVSEITKFLVGQLAPTQKLKSINNSTGNKVATWVLGLSGASLPKNSTDLNKYYSLAYDQASPTYNIFRSQIQSGHTGAAIKTANQYNDQLTQSLQKAWEENNPGKTISSQEVSKYIQGLYNSPWIKTTSKGLHSASKPTTSILNKIK